MGWSCQGRQTKEVIQTKPSYVDDGTATVVRVCVETNVSQKSGDGESRSIVLLPLLHGPARLRCPMKVCAMSLAERRGGRKGGEEGHCLPTHPDKRSFAQQPP
jgi:hypothetical protein